MAKPGSGRAREIANGGAARAHDLSAAGMSDKEVREASELIEFQLGMRCGGCGQRIVVGFHFYSIAPKESRPVLKLAACTRDDCDFAEKAHEAGSVIEAVEFAWIDEWGVDAPASELPQTARFARV